MEPRSVKGKDGFATIENGNSTSDVRPGNTYLLSEKETKLTIGAAENGPPTGHDAEATAVKQD